MWGVVFTACVVFSFFLFSFQPLLPQPPVLRQEARPSEGRSSEPQCLKDLACIQNVYKGAAAHLGALVRKGGGGLHGNKPGCSMGWYSKLN